MPKYTFKEILNYFGTKLNSAPPDEDLEAKEVELVVDGLPILITEGAIDGSLKLEIVMGFLLNPVKEERLKELATSNFLGVNTGGCTFALEELSGSLILRMVTPSHTSLQENWEWLHRILNVAHGWIRVLRDWDEFLSLAKIEPTKEEPHHDYI